MARSLQQVAAIHARRVDLHQRLTGAQLGDGYFGERQGGLVLWVAQRDCFHRVRHDIESRPKWCGVGVIRYNAEGAWHGCC